MKVEVVFFVRAHLIKLKLCMVVKYMYGQVLARNTVYDLSVYVRQIKALFPALTINPKQILCSGM